MHCYTKEATYIVGLNGTKRKVLSRYRHFAQSVEQGTLANIRQTHNSHLYTDIRLIVAITPRACDLSWPKREEKNISRTGTQATPTRAQGSYLQVGLESPQHGLLHRLFLLLRRHLEGVSTD